MAAGSHAASPSAEVEEYVAFDSDSDCQDEGHHGGGDSPGLSLGNVEGAEQRGPEAGEEQGQAGAGKGDGEGDNAGQVTAAPINPSSEVPVPAPSADVQRGMGQQDVAQEVEQQIRLARGVPAAVPDDPRITLLFDLNGVLFVDKREKQMRNGIKALRKLSKKHFRLGVYSSRNLANIGPAMHVLNKALGENVFTPGLTLSRNQCYPASEAHLSSANAKPWDVVKPLEPSFPGGSMARVILLDDDAFKAVPGEERNMIVLPSCKNEHNNQDTVLRDLVESLTHIQRVSDVREHTDEISRDIARTQQEAAAKRAAASAAGADESAYSIPLFAVLRGKRGSGIYTKMKEAKLNGNRAEYVDGEAVCPPTCYKQCATYAAARDFLNKQLGVSLEYMTWKQLRCIAAKHTEAVREGFGDKYTTLHKSEFYSVVRSSKEKTVVVRTKFPLSSDAFPSLVQCFEDTGELLDNGKAVYHRALQLAESIDGPDSKQVETVSLLQVQTDRPAASMQPPATGEEGATTGVVYKIPFYAVLLGSKGSMITTKSKEAFKLCKHGAYRAGLTCGCYLQCATYEAARAFLNQHLCLSMDWMARTQLRPISTDHAAVMEGFDGFKAGEGNWSDNYSVVRSKDGRPVVVRTKFPLTRSMVPDLIRCFKESEGGAYKKALQLAENDAASSPLILGKREHTEEPTDKEEPAGKASRLATDSAAERKAVEDGKLAATIGGAQCNAASQSQLAHGLQTQAAGATFGGMEVIDLTGDDPEDAEAPLAESGPETDEEADALPSSSSSEAEIQANPNSTSPAQPTFPENATASEIPDTDSQRVGAANGDVSQEPVDGFPASDREAGVDEADSHQALLRSDSEPLVSGLDDYDESDKSGDEGAEGRMLLGGANDDEEEREEDEDEYLGELHSPAGAKRPASEAVKSKEESLAVSSEGMTLTPIQDGSADADPPGMAGPPELDLERLRQPLVDLSSMPASERNMWLLHNQVAELSNHMIPSRASQEAVSRLLARVRAAALKAFGARARVVLFGSRATGLALSGGDVDIVILGLKDVSMTNPSKGLTGKRRKKAVRSLTQLLNLLVASKDLQTHKFLKTAKVPIIKGTMLEGGREFDVDICLGAASGVDAIKLVMDKVALEPALRPLVICVKAFLRQKGLSELYSGGLSSYAVFNLVLAHLLAERSASGNTCGVLSIEDVKKDGEANRRACLGFLLWSFFHRFGITFDYKNQAVSILHQGFIEKQEKWHKSSSPWLLAIEDPQEPGCNIGVGAFNIRMVRAAFAAAADVLEASDNMGPATSENAEQREARLWATVQADGASSSRGTGMGMDRQGTDDSMLGPDPLGGIMDWQAEFSMVDGQREQATEAGRAQVASAAYAIGLGKGAPGGRVRFSNNKDASNGGQSKSGAAKRQGKKTGLAKAKAKAAESMESRVARITSVSPASQKRGRPPSGGAGSDSEQHSGEKGGKRRQGRRPQKRFRNAEEKSTGRQSKRGRWNVG